MRHAQVPTPVTGYAVASLRHGAVQIPAAAFLKGSALIMKSEQGWTCPHQQNFLEISFSIFLMLCSQPPVPYSSALGDFRDAVVLPSS